MHDSFSGPVRCGDDQVGGADPQVRDGVQGGPGVRPHQGGAEDLLRQPHHRRGLQHHVPGERVSRAPFKAHYLPPIFRMHTVVHKSDMALL